MLLVGIWWAHIKCILVLLQELNQKVIQFQRLDAMHCSMIDYWWYSAMALGRRDNCLLHIVLIALLCCRTTRMRN